MNVLAVDTNAYSAFMLGEAQVVDAMRRAHEIHLPLIVMAELLAGFAFGTRKEINREQLARFMASPRVHLLKPDEKTARIYAEVFTALRGQGTPIPTNDLWIASLARQHQLGLLTLDAHFRHVPGLTVLP
jgi:tRNA(fMet)-specific endonuclease VapC